MTGLCISPQELSADRAEGWLAEEGGCELVVLDEMNLGLLESSSPPVEGCDSILRSNLHRWFTRHCGERSINKSRHCIQNMMLVKQL